MTFGAGNVLTAADLDARYVPLAGGVLLTSSMTGIANATFTDVTWDTEVSDPDGWHAAGVAGLVVPAGKGSRYAITYDGHWSALPGTIAGATGWINGVAVYQTGATNSLITDYSNTLTYVRTLAVGDTLKFQCYQNSGSVKNLLSRLEIAPI